MVKFPQIGGYGHPSYLVRVTSIALGTLRLVYGRLELASPVNLGDVYPSQRKRSRLRISGIGIDSTTCAIRSVKGTALHSSLEAWMCKENGIEGISELGHPYEVLHNHNTVWVNGGPNGECLARFGPIMIDVHSEDTSRCLYCRSGRGRNRRVTDNDWLDFVEKLYQHHGINLIKYDRTYDWEHECNEEDPNGKVHEPATEPATVAG